MARHIVPIPAANDDGPAVVVEVRQKPDSHPLDVELIGCEGENPYVATIQQRDIGKLKRNFKGSDEEWKGLLSHFLLQKQPEGGNSKILDGVRMVSSLKAEDRLEIIFRQDVQGIKVTLGEIVLPYDEETELNPFEWAQVSAQAHALALNQIVELKSQLSSKQEVVDKLNFQLEDFLKTKNEGETAMLQQFMQLLNEKKRKIRDQQRLLAGAKVDKSSASSVQAAREETKPRKAGPSRASKRKAPTIAAPAEPEPEPESEVMEVDEVKAEDDEEENEDIPGANTPDRTTDEETDDEGNSVEGSLASSVPQSELRERTAVPGRTNRTFSQASKKTSAAADPPSRRELPFGRPTARTKPASKQPSPPAVEDDDDETEDEEL
ncbi:uncharacterized protein BDR25DRAFT_223610 [Lindgomyces ingoldianus]|uniref:Uncharacterized protein n=1 Tax=Lindgomyces ingoldianus TaxID=673940 RepID=A0ACB6QWS1_9PLEO|nr:uncharacterized protein BDR25DRAFT_223610 [Lindgomyces ingoldianus]KAF2471326.1 hypothetical protein BDR25DRAFT_223610 [Lindgomyces ingoldianus]